MSLESAHGMTYFVYYRSRTVNIDNVGFYFKLIQRTSSVSDRLCTETNKNKIVTPPIFCIISIPSLEPDHWTSLIGPICAVIGVWSNVIALTNLQQL